MRVISIISTKGGVGKTTVAANLGGFLAEAGLRVLMIDLDNQPTLSSYYPLAHRADGGSYELLAFNEQNLSHLASHTDIDGLDIILSNDTHRQLGTLLLNAPDGRLRLRHLLPVFEPHYDLVLIDTQGACSVVLEMSVLAADLAISPVTPEILAARELQRGTLQLIEDIAPYRNLGITPPPLYLLVNRIPAVSKNARIVQQALRHAFSTRDNVHLLQSTVPAIEAFPRAASRSQPAHRVEYRRPSGRTTASALEIMRDLAIELLPQWQERFVQLASKVAGGKVHVDP